MTIQITIIGLGHIGTSIGLALAGKEGLVRVGNDIEPGIARQAEKLGALDKVVFNLPNAVRQADLVVLALPADQVKETLELIAPDLKPGAVVMDTAPIKTAVANWANELLPGDRYYIGITPAINPLYLMEPGWGIERARADMFQKGLFAIMTPSSISSEAIQLAMDFAALLGAEHMFIDQVEIDGLMSSTHILPQLMSAALLDMTSERAGWQEGRKVAGRVYAQMTDPMMSSESPTALACAVVNNSPNIVRLLDTLIAALEDIRAEVKDQDSGALEKRFTRIRDGRMKWFQERGMANWAAREIAPPNEIPTSSEWLGRLFGFRSPRRRKN